MDIKFQDIDVNKASVLVVGVFENCHLTGIAKTVENKTGGAVLKACKLRKFKGKKGEHVLILFPANMGVDAVILAGLGDPKKIDEYQAECIGGALIPYLNRHKLERAAFVVDKSWDGSSLKSSEIAARMAHGALLRSYEFAKYKTTRKDDEVPTLKELTFMLDDNGSANNLYKGFRKLAEAVYTTRDLVSEPANEVYPESLADYCKSLSDIGIDVQVLGEDQMKKLGMGSLLGVGQGSERESRIVSMRWDGAGPEKEKTQIAFIGKGVTFDSGGISIKPSGGMEEMKWDMAGAGAVIGVMKSLALRKAKINAVGVVGLVENMPSGTAQRPGDVVKSMSGQTIEVVNTDAEGRLVLADVLWYAQEKFKPTTVIDLATLTGAIIVAIGSFKAGLFSNNDKLAEKLLSTGKSVGEPLWQMPLGDEYDKQINSDIADMKNVGEGRDAGSTAGAQFLKRFIKEGVHWAHLDIAGVAWSKKDSDICPKGATGYGVRLLDKLVAEHFE